ncbi:MAG TPA: helix-turn-helix domain-containing protein [Telluria sp.]|jgi:transcriptional regulator GlxA family with amidase domain
MKITILVLEGVFDTGVSALLDAFTTANELSAMQTNPVPPFELTLGGVRDTVTSFQGFTLPVIALAQCPQADLVIVPALGYKMPDQLLAALARADVRDACTALRAFAASGTRVAAACIGTFVLAESGLLDQHEATTTWWLTPLFRQRYPKVSLDTSRMIVSSGACLTGGAALSHLDMALWIIRESSPDLAGLVARYLVVDQRASQASYVISDHLAKADPMVARFDRWVRDNLDQRFDLGRAASDMATSKRTLARRLQGVLGKTPVSYVQDVRIEHAVHLIKTSSLSMERIATTVGYGDSVTLRTLLRRKLGKGIRALREQG